MLFVSTFSISSVLPSSPDSLVKIARISPFPLCYTSALIVYILPSHHAPLLISWHLELLQTILKCTNLDPRLTNKRHLCSSGSGLLLSVLHFSGSIDLPPNFIVFLRLYRILIYTNPIFIFCSSFQGHRGSSYFLAIVNMITMNVTEKVYML